jgi:hypothetical protein
LLQDREASTRSHAAILLAKRGTRAAVEPLAKALHDEDLQVRRYSAIALARLGDGRGVGELLKLPRTTSISQGRMNDALSALNFVRSPEAAKTLSALRWEEAPPWHQTLREALDELSKRSGLKVTISKGVQERGLRFPLDWPRGNFAASELACQAPWDRFISLVFEPGEIRVLTPDEALLFWETWAKSR